MKYSKKLTTLLALVLSLTVLWGCGQKEPQLPEEQPNPGEEQQQQQQPQQNIATTAPSATIVCSDGNTTLTFL